MTDVPKTDPIEVSSEWRQRVAGTLINPVTLLATDYLNHFNEVVMLIGMVPDMPDMLPEALTWQLKTYPEHFRASGLDYGELAAMAYDAAPRDYREPFDRIVLQLAQAIRLTLKRLEATMAVGDQDELRRIAATASTTLTTLIGSASDIIGGGQVTLPQSKIDRLMDSLAS